MFHYAKELTPPPPPRYPPWWKEARSKFKILQFLSHARRITTRTKICQVWS
jgi:hypothetical protein